MTRTVVVVDDDPEILDFLQLVISLQGFYVVASDYSGDVMAVIHDAHPDAVLLDLQNGPDHQAGLAILESLRANDVTASLLLILMTSNHIALNQHQRRLQELKVIPLQKPFGVNEMVRLIEQAA